MPHKADALTACHYSSDDADIGHNVTSEGGLVGYTTGSKPMRKIGA
ncbi:MAG: hypothetical protein R3D29_05155 [Nitratireductor sp.]